MPKKMGINSKAETARARRSATEAERKERDAREKEEHYWRQAEGDKSRAAKKREEEADKRAEAAAKKAEARRLAELEAKDLEKSLKKPDKKADRVSAPVPKVTESELRRRKEEEQAALQRRAEEDKKKKTRTADEEEYERMISVANTNRDDSVIEARTVEDAIAQMTMADTLPVDKHPEKRLKASFKAFEEAELPKLKEEKRGLTHNQYKDMIWKLWKKSPDNPLNQMTKFYQSRKSQRIVIALVQGHQVPLYGGIPLVIAAKVNTESMVVPLNLTFVMRSRAYILGRLVKPTFYCSISCQVTLRGNHLGKPLNLTKTDSCVYN